MVRALVKEELEVLAELKGVDVLQWDDVVVDVFGLLVLVVG